MEASAGVDREFGLAQVSLSPRAEEASAAGADQTDDHPVAWANAFDVGSHRFDDARGLVAIDRRKPAAPCALDVVDVAVADRASGDVDPNLAPRRRVEPQLLDDERRAEGAADCRFHDAR